MPVNERQRQGLPKEVECRPVMPSEEWIRERYLQHKDKIWEMKGVRISEMAAAEAAKEAEKEEEAKKSSEGEEEAEERDKVAASEAAAQDRSKGRGKRAPAGSESEANSESESESESDAEDDTEICSRWTLKMMEEEDADTCDGNAATETVVDLSSLSHLPETEDDRESIKSPSKRGSLPHPLIHMLAYLILLSTCAGARPVHLYSPTLVEQPQGGDQGGEDMSILNHPHLQPHPQPEFTSEHQAEVTILPNTEPEPPQASPAEVAYPHPLVLAYLNSDAVTQ